MAKAEQYRIHGRWQAAPSGTWLEDEECSYPHGGMLRRGRAILRRNPHNPTLALPYGEVRNVMAGIADTAFTVPASVRYKGKRVRGFLSAPSDGEAGALYFTPEADASREHDTRGECCKGRERPMPICQRCNRPLARVAQCEDVWGCADCKETWHLP